MNQVITDNDQYEQAITSALDAMAAAEAHQDEGMLHQAGIPPIVAALVRVLSQQCARIQTLESRVRVIDSAIEHAIRENNGHLDDRY